MIKKYMHLCIFGVLTLLLPFILFITDGGASCLIPNIIENEGIEETDHSEKTNYYVLLFSEDKNAGVKPGDKVTLESNHDQQTDSDKSPESAPEQNQQVSVVASAETGQQSAGSSPSFSQKEQQMVNLINEARKNAGLPALQVNSQLTSAARAKSNDMVNYNYFSHTSPTYGDLGGLLRRFGITYSAAGENLAMNSNGSVSAAHNSLMGSAGHRANILNIKFRYVGIGIHTKNDGSHYYTQLFIGR